MLVVRKGSCTLGRVFAPQKRPVWSMGLVDAGCAIKSNRTSGSPASAKGFGGFRGEGFRGFGGSLFHFPLGSQRFVPSVSYRQTESTKKNDQNLSTKPWVALCTNNRPKFEPTLALLATGRSRGSDRVHDWIRGLQGREAQRTRWIDSCG